MLSAPISGLPNVFVCMCVCRGGGLNFPCFQACGLSSRFGGLEDETLSACSAFPCISLSLPIVTDVIVLFCHLSSPLSCLVFSNDVEATDGMAYPVRVPPGLPSHGHRRLARFIDSMRTSVWGYDPSKVCLCVRCSKWTFLWRSVLCSATILLCSNVF